MSKFLSHGGVRCEHEPSKTWYSMRDAEEYFSRNEGAVDSMLTLKWRELRAIGVNLIAVSRPRVEVQASIEGAGLPDSPLTQRLLTKVYDEIEQFDGPHYNFCDIDDVAPDIFAWATGRTCPWMWFNIWRHRHVEADFADVVDKTDLIGAFQFYNLGII